MTDPNEYKTDEDLALLESVWEVSINKLVIALNTGANRNVTDMTTGSPVLFSLMDKVHAAGDDSPHAGTLAAMMVNFIVKKPDVNLPDKNGRLPLQHALQLENYFLADLLITAGADVSRALEDGDTPLHRAVRLAAAGQGSRLLSTLLNAGADPTLPNAAGITAFDIALASDTASAEGIRRALSATPQVQALIDAKREETHKQLRDRARRHGFRLGQ